MSKALNRQAIDLNAAEADAKRWDALVNCEMDPDTAEPLADLFNSYFAPNEKLCKAYVTDYQKAYAKARARGTTPKESAEIALHTTDTISEWKINGPSGYAKPTLSLINELLDEGYRRGDFATEIRQRTRL